ncbi:S9 family peptidase [Xylella taiwanensis]|uniref:Peptidase S9 n=1 Tax=Xylella taiwanensis TaxID=1444770 RepID=Z9JM77_9GAMM|nr:S9 family peptidase [Xylella taiwanensis]AXI82485.1 peptidase S9 [Xylella taiwanensis]EWS79279.1 peptidase S9 [Xylella taiwanensis]MCD8455477.1 S9 family peptidase [Xylella taiwanensis]MCD8457882.1 S9 family peptidase [Xylella taiwanensis]MCD8460017.1 S9 family peptidase [Xylella taiwanensis]
MSRLFFLSICLLTASVSAQTTSTPLTIEQIMADPDWIGSSVDVAWWKWDSHEVQYERKRENSPVHEIYRQPLRSNAAHVVSDTLLTDLDAPNPVYDRQRRRMLFVRHGDIFLRDLRKGVLVQLTRSNQNKGRPQFATDGGVIWHVGNDWYHWMPQGGVVQLTDIHAGPDPDTAPKSDPLRDQQLKHLATLRNERAEHEALKQQDQIWRAADPSRATAPVYLGEEVVMVDSSLSPDGRHLLLVTKPKNVDEGQVGKMPRYVTESGYEEFQEVRTRVGRNMPVPHTLWLINVIAGTAHKLSFSSLPGITDDPLAALRKANGKAPLRGERPVRIENDADSNGPAIRWSEDGHNVAVEIRTIDNKDRWIAAVDLEQATLNARHRLHDSAWINWDFNDFGWLPDNRTLWLLSEESGYSHLYTVEGTGTPKQRTFGQWEVSAPQLSVDGRSVYFVCNPTWPGGYEICKLDLGSGHLDTLTALEGVEDFSLSPDGRQLLVRYSGRYLPPQLALISTKGGQARVLTDTRSTTFKAQQWIQPEYVQIPSKHGAGVIWGKYYGPASLEPDRRYPIVMFVHGAGYLQNVSARYTSYFREQMFHTLLVQKGYIVLDLDYRASAGYGRHWRTAIYRNMGHPELEDYLDGLDWLVAHKQGDLGRAGIYGGSYGGFMTYMAMFRAAGTFKAGAALRPVGNWMQYNHEYTSNILNTPELDPEAYQRSSPMNYVEALQGHLLIVHGMIDDNVFFKDSVDMVQKLIELRKDNWEIVPYPLERHGFIHADAWVDEYKRILKLFETQLQP